MPSGKIRVSFPGDSASQYTVVGSRNYPDGSERAGLRKVPIRGGLGGTNRSGSILAFMANIFDTNGIPWEEVPISQRSREVSPNSSFTACVHDVAIANTDVCWVRALLKRTSIGPDRPHVAQTVIALATYLRQRESRRR